MAFRNNVTLQGYFIHYSFELTIDASIHWTIYLYILDSQDRTPRLEYNI